MTQLAVPLTKARLFVFTIRRDQISLQTILLCLKILFSSITKQTNLSPLAISVLFCYDFPVLIFFVRHLNQCLPFSFVLLQKFLIHRYQRVIMSDNAKLSQKFLIRFSVITSTKLWSLSYLQVNFYKKNSENN